MLQVSSSSSSPRRLSVLDEDDGGFEDYIETTINPGNSLMVAALLICIGSLMLLTFTVALGRRCLIHRSSNDGGSGVGDEQSHQEQSHQEQSHLTLFDHISRIYNIGLYFIVDALASFRPFIEMKVHRKKSLETQSSCNLDVPNTVSFNANDLQQSSCDMQDDSRHLQIERSDVSHNVSSRNNKAEYYCYPCRTLCTIIKWDHESKRILHLSIPFMISNLSKTGAGLLILIIISQHLGTDSMVAFAMVEVVVGISSSFFEGWIQSIASLGAMAYGAENYDLLGQYVQIASVVYFICQIPMTIIWGFSMYDIMLLFGFDEDTATIAGNYVWVYSAKKTMEGLLMGFLDFLEVIEKERSAMIIFFIGSACEVGLVAGFAKYANANLLIIGMVILTNKCLFVFITVLFSTWKQWTIPYEYGLIGKNAFLSPEVFKLVMKTAMPLSFGGLLAYAEWEILTIYAAVLGPAEVATWAILGFVWDVFESTTEAIGDAAMMRCAYHLGRGRPGRAQISAYKSMIWTFAIASGITTTFLLLHKQLPGWLTNDPTIKDLLIELFPLVGLGNITMTVGMVCWALVGAQMKYHLATAVNLGCSMLITLPIGAITSIWLRIDLQGLTFSVVIGYAICALILTNIILLSDWEVISKNVRDNVANSDQGSCSSLDWEDLPEEVKVAASKLGYTEHLWDNDMEPIECGKPWAHLCPEQQEAVQLLGYDQKKWDHSNSPDERKQNDHLI